MPPGSRPAGGCRLILLVLTTPLGVQPTSRKAGNLFAMEILIVEAIGHLYLLILVAKGATANKQGNGCRAESNG